MTFTESLDKLKHLNDDAKNNKNKESEKLWNNLKFDLPSKSVEEISYFIYL